MNKEKTSKLVRISLSLEDDLLENLSTLATAEGCENRSEYIRNLIRGQMAREQWESGREVVATLTLIYNHHQRGLTEKLVDIQHHCGEHILAATHVHLSHEVCVEAVIFRGKSDTIKAAADAMKRLRGVLHAELSMGTTGEFPHEHL